MSRPVDFLRRLAVLIPVLSFGACADSGLFAEKPAPAPMTPADVERSLKGVDWGSAIKVELGLGEKSFEPMILVLESGKAHRLRLANLTESSRTLSAENFFKTVAVRSMVVGADVTDKPILSSVSVAPGTPADIYMVPTQPGIFDFDCGGFFCEAFGVIGRFEVR